LGKQIYKNIILRKHLAHYVKKIVPFQLKFGKKGKYLVFYFMMVNKRNLRSLLKVYDKFSVIHMNFFMQIAKFNINIHCSS